MRFLQNYFAARHVDISNLDACLLEVQRKGHPKMPIHKRRAGSRSASNVDPKGIIDKAYLSGAENLMRRVDRWDFNIFAVDRFSGGQPMIVLGMHLFQKHGLMTTFKLDPVKLIKTLHSIEETYQARNPYHNSVHAADVTQAMHCYLLDCKLRCKLTPLDKMCCLLGAMCHDADHPGVNQAFLEKTDNYLVHLYQSKSVLENHHWRVTVSILHDTGLFNHLSPDVWTTISKYISDLILATDISQQATYLKDFVRLTASNSLDMENNEDHKLLVLQIALKCADICNPCRVWSVCCSWANLVCEEFFRQGDRERRLGLPIGGQNDRYVTTQIKIQIGFVEFLVKPLFNQWHNFILSDLSTMMLTLCDSNLSKWREKGLRESPSKNNSALAPSPSPVYVGELGPLREEDSCDESESSSSRMTSRRHSLPVNLPGASPKSWTSRRFSLPHQGRILATKMAANRILDSDGSLSPLQTDEEAGQSLFRDLSNSIAASYGRRGSAPVIGYSKTLRSGFDIFPAYPSSKYLLEALATAPAVPTWCARRPLLWTTRQRSFSLELERQANEWFAELQRDPPSPMLTQELI